MPAAGLVERRYSFKQALWLLQVHRDHRCRHPRQPGSALARQAETRLWATIRRKIDAAVRALAKGEG